MIIHAAIAMTFSASKEGIIIGLKRIDFECQQQ